MISKRLDHLRINWKLEVDGRLATAGVTPTPVIRPGRAAEIQINLNDVPRTAGAISMLTIAFTTATETRWSPPGHEIAWAQFRTPDPKTVSDTVSSESATVPDTNLEKTPNISRKVSNSEKTVSDTVFLVERDRQSISFVSNASQLSFDTVRGKISSWKYQGVDVLQDGPRLNLWRAVTDNDRLDHHSGKADKAWRDSFLHLLQHRTASVDCTENVVTIKSVVAPPNKFIALHATYVYTVLENGGVVLETSGEFRGTWPGAIPRIGLRLSVPAEYTRAKWLGRGPGESYSDSKQAVKFGLWSMPVDELFTNYIYPQENGNRTDVRWAELSRENGTGLRVVAEREPPINFSAHRYTAEDLDAARHFHELKKRDYVTLNIDYAQNGLGTASCGPAPLQQYLLKPETFRFKVTLSPVRPGSGSIIS